jgi:hypothetical protein
MPIGAGKRGGGGVTERIALASDERPMGVLAKGGGGGGDLLPSHFSTDYGPGHSVQSSIRLLKI